MSTAEALVIGTVGLSVFMYYLRRLQYQRQALHWFYTKQSQQLMAQAETIREQLLQQAFALSRAVELGAMNSAHASMQQWKTCLTLTNEFNQSLENLSNELSPPFAADSLPLALQHLVMQQWGSVQAKLELPDSWPIHQSDRHRIILWCVQECLMALFPNPEKAQANALKICLTETSGMAKLNINLDKQSSVMVAWPKFLDELNHIKQIFQLFMLGRFKVKCNDSRIRCVFSWSLTRTLPPLDTRSN